MNKVLLYTFLFLLPTTWSTAQTTPPRGSLSSGTIESQFNHLNSISRSQDDFKLIRKTNLEIIKKNVADSLNLLRSQIASTASNQTQQQEQISSLSDSLATTRQALQEAENNQEQVTLLGISLHKTTYGIIFIVVVAVLVLLLLFYLYRFNQNNVIAKDVKKAYDDLQEEFDKHRKRAMEKEQKLKRQIQDEINRRHG